MSLQDIFDFLVFCFVSEPCGDFDTTGLPATVRDYFGSLAAFFTGCA